jgi:Barstar (barnase inhibitor)
VSENVFRQRGVHHAPATEVREAVDGFEEDGWKVFVLPDGINDHESFVSAVQTLLPLNPVWQGRSWDALADCLGEGLWELPDRRIAILWPDAKRYADAEPKTYAFDVMRQVSDQLSEEEPNLGNPKDVAFVVGT